MNLPHLALIPHQRQQHGLDKGFLVCNSNCAVIGLVIPFAALQKRFGPIDAVSVVTMQAVSGAGYPGVSSMDILDNVVPYIAGEEDKLETEAQKILGGLNPDATGFAELSCLRVSAACNRVPVLDGHTACVSLRFAERDNLPSVDKVKAALREYVCEAQPLGCPSAPEPPIVVFDEPDRPQPRLDRDLSRGYTVSVGRVREDESGIFDFKFVALSHNSELKIVLPEHHRLLPEIPESTVQNFLTTIRVFSCDRGCWIEHTECRGGCPQRLHLGMGILDSGGRPNWPAGHLSRLACCLIPGRTKTNLPIMLKTYGCFIEEEKHSRQQEILSSGCPRLWAGKPDPPGLCLRQPTPFPLLRRDRASRTRPHSVKRAPWTLELVTTWW